LSELIYMQPMKEAKTMRRQRWWLVAAIAMAGLGTGVLIELLAHQAAGPTPVFGRYTWKYLLMVVSYVLIFVAATTWFVWRALSKRKLGAVSTRVGIVFLLAYILAFTGIWVLLPRIAASLLLSSNLLLRPILLLAVSLGFLSLPKPDSRLWGYLSGTAVGLGILGAALGFWWLYYHYEVECAVHEWVHEYRVDDWPQWRADSAHSGYLSGHGEISAPTVAWSYFLGGMPSSAFVVDEHSDALVVLAGGGHLTAFSETGDTRWTTETFAEPSILGAWDLNGDGVPDLVVLDNDRRRGAIQVVSSHDGEEIYRTEHLGGRVGAVMAADLTGDAIPELIWGPAAVSEVYAYTLVDTPEVLWVTTLEDYVSDPSTFSTIAVGDVNADGQPEVVVAGARGQSVVIILSHTGEELGRTGFNPGDEAGGTRHLIWVGPLDGLPGDDILIAGGWPIQTYMFQGIARFHVESNAPVLDAEISLAPYGPRYVRYSLDDVDSDGSYEILFTRYDPDEGHDEIVMLDVMTSDMEARIPEATLLGIIPPADRESPLTLVTQASDNVIQAWSLGADGEPTPLWSLPAHDVAIDERATILPPNVMFYGPDLHTLDTDGDGSEEILTLTRVSEQQWQIDTFDARNGAHVTQAAIQSPGQPDILWSGEDGLIVASPEGRVLLLDAQLNVRSTLGFGGFYYRSDLPNGEREVAAVADIDGDGVASVLALNAMGQVLSIDGQGHPTLISDVDERVSEFLSADLDGDGALDIITSTECTITVRDGDGGMVWERHFEGCSGEPRGSSVGDLNADGTLDVATFVPVPLRDYAPLTALDGRDGHILWDTASFPWAYQGYGSSIATVGLLNNDSYADTIFSSNALKGAALQGNSGHILTTPVRLPPYLYLGSVDYAGAIILLDADDDQIPEVLNALDRAHLALLELPSDYCATTEPSGRNALQASWVAPQVFLDDEVLSAPAVVPEVNMYGSAIIGLGSARGIFRARDAATGDLLWEVGLVDGQAVPDAGEVSNALGSAAAADINGDGVVEFVIGGTDGWLYALRATDGSLVWAYEAGYPLGEPILGDIDNDGLLEIVLPAADGYLYALDE
jgi:outer membrane protein assembly factor BamB